MVPIITETEMTLWFYQLFWPFCRFSAFLLAAPFFGSNFVNVRIRVALAFFLSLVVFPWIDIQRMPAFLSAEFILTLIHQIGIGLFLGFLVQLFMEVFIIAGQLISMQTGLSMAMMFDPSTGTSVPILSQWLSMMAMMIYLSLNGHLVLLQVLIQSFEAFPIGPFSFSALTLFGLVDQGSWMFASALWVCLPAIVALLVMNLAFGIMTRVAPQFNIFSIGLPFTLTVGLLIFYVNLGQFLPAFETLYTEHLDMLKQLMRF
jgi:flagellar biosynthetic protein FliR